MSDNDIIKRGELKKQVLDYVRTHIVPTVTGVLALIDDAPAVPHEMSAVEYIREHRRMCDFYFGKSTTDGGWCGDCPFRENGKKDCWLKPGRSESSISIVEKWAREHPERSEE